VADLGAFSNDDAGVFIPADKGGVAGEGPVVAQGMEVGVADAREEDFNEDFGVGGGGYGDFFVDEFWEGG